MRARLFLGLMAAALSGIAIGVWLERLQTPVSKGEAV